MQLSVSIIEDVISLSKIPIALAMTYRASIMNASPICFFFIATTRPRQLLMM